MIKLSNFEISTKQMNSHYRKINNPQDCLHWLDQLDKLCLIQTHATNESNVLSLTAQQMDLLNRIYELWSFNMTKKHMQPFMPNVVLLQGQSCFGVHTCKDDSLPSVPIIKH